MPTRRSLCPRVDPAFGTARRQSTPGRFAPRYPAGSGPRTLRRRVAEWPAGRFVRTRLGARAWPFVLHSRTIRIAAQRVRAIGYSRAVRYWRYIWALPSTMLGLLLASLALVGGRVRVVAGVVEAHGPWLRWVLSTCVPLRGGAAAIT